MVDSLSRLTQTPAAICVILLSLPTLTAEPDFDAVKSLLESRCLSCHNTQDRKGDFSLETHEQMTDSGQVSPGSPEESGLLQVVLSEGNEAPSMPKDGTPLTAAEAKVLHDWIAAGAKWPASVTLSQPAVTSFDWWSFQPIRNPPIPDVQTDTASWLTSPIDRFVLDRLQKKGMQPSDRADRRTLIRRVTYDLTGLPPTPAQVEAFVNDKAPNAWTKLIDRLLDAPQYGERWARHWLDVVKYADTCGYDKDKLRPNSWPYRDYVIRSFNEDKPWTQFVQEQIAGDVIYPGTSDGILGLGFVAAGPWDFIGHVEVPESKIDGRVARNLDRDEMVTNTLNAFCSVTIQCARCHNHKFDPFSQEHYYSLQSVFAAVDRAERVYDTDPKIEQRRRELTAAQTDAANKLRKLEKEIADAGGDELKQLNAEIKTLSDQTNPKDKRPEYGYHSALVKKNNIAKWVEVDLGESVEVTHIILNACHDEFAGINSGFGFPVRFRVEGRINAGDKLQVIQDFTGSDFRNPRLIPVEAKPAAPVAVRFVRVTATVLAERQNDYMLALSELQIFDSTGKNVAHGKPVNAVDSIEAPVRWRKSNLTDGIWPQAEKPEAFVKLEKLQDTQDELLKHINTPERMQRKQHLEKARDKAAAEIGKLPKGRVVYAAATHFNRRGNFMPTQGVPRTVKVLHRGNIQQPLDEVSPGVIPLRANSDWKLPLAENHSEGDRRAALAKWITDPNNPLTWRSIANRIWQYHFGRGLVESPNDFGRMGQQPTHPKLLDWLASEFRRTQSIKHMHRLILTSQTWQQSSGWNAGMAEQDSDNQYYWRFNRRRLSAEELRDSILSVSGKLNLKMGGPGFYLFVLEKTAHSPHYEYHKFDPSDENSHRRSIYRFIVRSQPDPWMTTLDCADSSQSTPRRSETLTSLQALSLLNNRFNLTMAKYFAERLQRETVETESNQQRHVATRAYQLVTGRYPTRQEADSLEAYTREHGAANLCRVLFNTSEFVFVD